jgi:hypothetical protein
MERALFLIFFFNRIHFKRTPFLVRGPEAGSYLAVPGLASSCACNKRQVAGPRGQAQHLGVRRPRAVRRVWLRSRPGAAWAQRGLEGR